MMNQPVYSVSQINTYIKRLINCDYQLSHIQIKGEVSNLKYHSSGHIYFTLKDEKGALSCVMFAGSRMKGLTFPMEDGQSIVVTGAINVYERDGKYQLYATSIALAGAGELYALYEQLKQRLYEEGLFEHDHKKEIPPYASKVGVVTASTGAAVQDIISIARRRNPHVELYIYPAKVQGQGAKESIVKGIRYLDKKGLDVIIIGRGGGSIEELWAFNEEMVARAVYEAQTPIISGVGHETDTTIADYVADKRAATPSAACELAVFQWDKLREYYDDYREALSFQMNHKFVLLRQKMKLYEARLTKGSPKGRLQMNQLVYQRKKDQVDTLMKDKLKNYRQRQMLYLEKLHGLSPTAKLTNGYGYITVKNQPVRSVMQVKTGEDITIRMSDGTVKASITEVKGE